jgi:hypothetical protein
MNHKATASGPRVAMSLPPRTFNLPSLSSSGHSEAGRLQLFFNREQRSTKPFHLIWKNLAILNNQHFQASEVADFNPGDRVAIFADVQWQEFQK